ncbi:hypothetical protein ACXZ1M_24340 [Duganella sp. PWIR1]
MKHRFKTLEEYIQIIDEKLMALPDRAYLALVVAVLIAVLLCLYRGFIY